MVMLTDNLTGLQGVAAEQAANQLQLLHSSTSSRWELTFASGMILPLESHPYD